MCDFSLKAVKSQPANVEDKIVTHNFGFGTIGFKPASDTSAGSAATAVCVIPGTEIAFDRVPERRFSWYMGETGEHMPGLSLKATFIQDNLENLNTHHDSLVFDNGVKVLLTHIEAGFGATVVRLPAAPQNDAEAKAQQRLEVVG